MTTANATPQPCGPVRILKPRKLTVLAVLTAASVALAGSPALAADPSPSGELTITGVVASTRVFGTPWRPSWDSHLDVAFEDSDPSLDTSRYQDRYYSPATSLDGEYGPNYYGADDASATGQGTLRVSPWFAPGGTAFDLWVKEAAYDAEYNTVVLDTSARSTQTMPNLVRAPKVGTITQKKNFRAPKSAPAGSAGGAIVAGKRVYINYSSAWEPGTRFTTRIGTVKGLKKGDFLGAYGDTGVIQMPTGARGSLLKSHQGARLTSFVVPASRVGQRLFVTQIGTRAGAFGVGFNWNNITLGFPIVKAAPARWVKSWGKVAGAAQRGKTVKASGFRWGSGAKKVAGEKVAYSWYLNGKKVRSGKSYTIARTVKVGSRHVSAKGKVLKLRITVSAKNHQTLTRTLTKKVR